MKLSVGVFSTSVGLTEVMTGTASTVKFVAELAVEEPTPSSNQP